MVTSTGQDLDKRLLMVCDYGRRAPSVHNIQPWQIELVGLQLRLAVPSERKLHFGDPTGRQTWLSLGCLIENVALAAEHVGLGMKTDFNFDAPANAEIGRISFIEQSPNPLPDLAKAMFERYSDRSAYLKQAIPSSHLARIQQAWLSDDVTVYASNETGLIETVAELTGQGIRLALGMPEFRLELSKLIHHNWDRRQSGLHGYALELSGARSLLEKPFVRYGLGIQKQSLKEQAMMRASAGLILVASRGDTPKFWLEAGRAYQRAALEAWCLGLHQSTTAAVVEAVDFHLDIEKLLGTKFRLQTVMRLGYSRNHRRATPRLPLEEIVTLT